MGDSWGEHSCAPLGFDWGQNSKINKEVSGKSQLSHSFDSWVVSFPGQKCVQIWITSNGQMPYLRDYRQSLIFGLRGELKGVYVSEIIRVRHLKIKILCQSIDIYEHAACPTADPTVCVHAGGEVLGPGERERPSACVCFSLSSLEQSSLTTTAHHLVQLPILTFLAGINGSEISFLTRRLAGLKK